MEVEPNVIAVAAAGIAAVVVAVVALVGMRTRRLPRRQFKAQLLDGSRNKGEARCRVSLPTREQLAAYSLWEWEGGGLHRTSVADPADGLGAPPTPAARGSR